MEEEAGDVPSNDRCTSWASPGRHDALGAGRDARLPNRSGLSLCSKAAKPACDNFVTDFNVLNSQIRDSLRRTPGC
jgi:hypothetical protein